MKNIKLNFDYIEIKTKYEDFINNFLSEEKNVIKENVIQDFWTISVPEKNFKCSITCKCTGNRFGIEEWSAVVEEINGEKNIYPLFEKEIEKYLSEYRQR